MYTYAILLRMANPSTLDVLQANRIAPLPPRAPTRLVEPTDVIDLTLSDDERKDGDEDNGVRDATSEIAALKVTLAFYSPLMLS